MSGGPKHGILSELKRPLIQPEGPVPAALEEKLLGTEPAAEPPKTQPEQLAPKGQGRRSVKRAPSVPVTFHLPIELRDRIKLTAQAKQKTMLEVALEAFQEYLDRNRVSEEDLRRLLGL